MKSMGVEEDPFNGYCDKPYNPIWTVVFWFQRSRIFSETMALLIPRVMVTLSKSKVIRVSALTLDLFHTASATYFAPWAVVVSTPGDPFWSAFNPKIFEALLSVFGVLIRSTVIALLLEFFISNDEVHDDKKNN